VGFETVNQAIRQASMAQRRAKMAYVSEQVVNVDRRALRNGFQARDNFQIQAAPVSRRLGFQAFNKRGGNILMVNVGMTVLFVMCTERF
jgi:hypothetical protein